MCYSFWVPAHVAARLLADICDDCCKNNRGATLMAQAYNIIKMMDPYHVISGASDCSGTFVFSDMHASCLGWQNEVNTTGGNPTNQGPVNCGPEGCVCAKPSTTDTSLPMIPYLIQGIMYYPACNPITLFVRGCMSDLCVPRSRYGQQPHQQLSLDYILQENYEGGLWRHGGDGHWTEGIDGDEGVNHQPNPFEPIANCPMNQPPANENLYSQ